MSKEALIVIGFTRPLVEQALAAATEGFVEHEREREFLSKVRASFYHGVDGTVTHQEALAVFVGFLRNVNHNPRVWGEEMKKFLTEADLILADLHERYTVDNEVAACPDLN